VDNDYNGYTDCADEACRDSPDCSAFGSCNGVDLLNNPPPVEIPYNGIDDDCNGSDLTDVDEDGFDGGETGTDCDDSNSEIHPGAPESCDGIDNDCDGQVDEEPFNGVRYYADEDGDGYGDYKRYIEACEESKGYVSNNTDCNDNDWEANPGADEICDAVDNDCNGSTDEPSAIDAIVWYLDADADFYGDPTQTQVACEQPEGYVSDDTDCDDSNETVNSGADEICDDVDNDCDGLIDPDWASGAADWYQDADGDGYGDPFEQQFACEQPTVPARLPPPDVSPGIQAIVRAPTRSRRCPVRTAAVPTG
jgi:hypothetical protein